MLQAADVTSESKALINDPNDANIIGICKGSGTANDGNCPSETTGQDLLCRLFTILPSDTNTNNLQSSEALVDGSEFDLTAEAGNDNGIVTVISNGCKLDQCRHADGTNSALSFVYDHAGTNDANAVPAQTPYAITATCDCDESKGETANVSPADATDPFECICNEAEACF